MKTKLIALALGSLVHFGAMAASAVSLPAGPVFFKFTGREQIAINGAHTGNGTIGAADEINWGVFSLDNISHGHVDEAHKEISPTGPAWFINGGAPYNAQVTGIFYGIKQATGAHDTLDLFPATGGFMDIYWRDNTVLGQGFTDIGSTAVAGLRTATDKATGYTEGTLLAHLAFTPGIDATNSTITISGNTVPNSNGFTGHADAFANVDMSMIGLWSSQLASQYFTTAFGLADLKFKNSYNQLVTWNGGSNILGAKIDDPGQAFALPEPGALSLMGLALVGMGAIRRRKQK
jgi:hypothetical protein